MAMLSRPRRVRSLVTRQSAPVTVLQCSAVHITAFTVYVAFKKTLKLQDTYAFRITGKHIAIFPSGMIVRKASNSKTDLQGHSRSPVMVPLDRPHTIYYQSSIAAMFLSCTVSK